MSKKQQNPTLLVKTGLTPVQEQTAILLASGENITSVAEKLNLNRSTIYQWQEMLTFQCFFNQQKQDIQEMMRCEIFSLGEMALKTLKDCLNSDNESVKLKASLAILEKIESASIGITNARDELRKMATYDPMEWVAEKRFDEDEYEKLLKENGLK